MLVSVARGTCEVCGKSEKATGSSEAEAKLLLVHGHGYEHRHGWRGEVSTHQEEESCATTHSSSKRLRS